MGWTYGKLWKSQGISELFYYESFSVSHRFLSNVCFSFCIVSFESKFLMWRNLKIAIFPCLRNRASRFILNCKFLSNWKNWVEKLQKFPSKASTYYFYTIFFRFNYVVIDLKKVHRFFRVFFSNFILFMTFHYTFGID